MSNYNADENFNLPQMVAVGREDLLIATDRLFSDQWSIDSANRVSSFHDGTKRIQIKIKFDPRVTPANP